MNVLLTGATGFLGSHLRGRLSEAGHKVLAVSRRPGVGYDWSEDSLRQGLAAADAVVHLAGENLFSGRWSASKKERLRTSRIETTGSLARMAGESGIQTLISASAVGYYGAQKEGARDALDEAAPHGDDFLARLCVDWEEAAAPARAAGVRLAQVRIGVILGPEGGALKRMLPPFRLGLGGPLGNGRQAVSWVHVGDLAELFLFLLENSGAEGVYNGTAPEPVTMGELARTLGRVLGRPAALPVPGFALRLLLGEAADVLLTGQRVVPRRATDAGFVFRHAQLEPALRDLLGKP